MRTRFASNLVVLLLGALMMGERFAFAAGTSSWLMFAAGCAVTVIVPGAFLVRGRGSGQRLLDACVAVISGWAVVSTRTFGADTAAWLGFAEGCAFAVLGLGGLVAHEARMERGIVVRAPAGAGEEDGSHAASPRMTLASWSRAS